MNNTNNRLRVALRIASWLRRRQTNIGRRLRLTELAAEMRMPGLTAQVLSEAVTKHLGCYEFSSGSGVDPTVCIKHLAGAM